MKEQNTDIKLFSILFEQYKEAFISYANSYIRDRIVAEDIYVEAMTQYWEKRNDLSSDTNIPAYILTSIKNKALNHLRHQHIKGEVEELLLNHSLRELQFRITSLESSNPSELFSSEIRNIVQHTLNEMPAQTCIIYRKSRYENKSNRDIADELGINVKTVEYHIGKALKILRKRLKDYLPLLLYCNYVL